MSRMDQVQFDKKTLAISILRLDLPDPVSGGNKRFKLKYNLAEMNANGQQKLVTFGGAFSNHIAAVAYVASKNNIQTVGVIRGEELNENSNAVLKFAASCGMKLHFIEREEYRLRYDKKYQLKLLERFEGDVILPEGGSNELAVNGCREILTDEAKTTDVIFCAVGTGATLAGLILSAASHQEVIGVAVLEGKEYLENEIRKYLGDQPVQCSWKVVGDFTFGGYGKRNEELDRFISSMDQVHHLPLDHVYSGKVLFAVKTFSEKKEYKGKKLMMVHTGGYAFAN